jgi:arylsulfatase A-like enzyme
MSSVLGALLAALRKPPAAARRQICLGLAGFAWLAGAASGWGADTRQKPARPNVLLIVMDTTRVDHLSCYGYSRRTTPNLDRIAAQGVLFEQAISAGSWTLPSHATLFTGLYARDHKTTAESWSLGAEFTTLAEVLTAAGYDTAGFSGNPWLSDATGLKRGFRKFIDVWRNLLPERPGDEGADLTVKLLLEWVDSAPTRRPFFAFVNFMEPHFSYNPPAGFERSFLPAGADPTQVAGLREWKHPRELGYILHVPGYEVTPNQFQLLGDLYDGEIAYVDSKLDELIRGLEKRDLLDETLLIVTADHGEHLGDHELMDHKMSVYDALIHVPLIIRCPRGVHRGVRIRGQVQTNDLFASVLGMCGVERPLPSGAAALPLDNRQAAREYAFAEFGPPTRFLQIMRNRFPTARSMPFDRSLVAIRGPRYKYIWASDGRCELFDIARDPGETKDLSVSLPKVAKELSDRVLAFRSPHPDDRPVSAR